MPVNEASLRQLAEPTPKDEIKTRKLFTKDRRPVLRDGKPVELSYIDARFVFDRLDTSCGQANWQTKFEEVPGVRDAIRCGIGILIEREEGPAEWVWKYDVGTESSIEPMKGQHSDAIKRAGVQWGIGRDLYSQGDDDTVLREVMADEAEQAPQPIRGRAGNGAAQPQPQYGTTMAAPPQQQYQPAVGLAPDGVTPTGVALIANGTDPSMLPWVCPIHGDVRLQVPGYAKNGGKAYAAFFGCPDRNCRERGMRYQPEWWPA